jgi:hypothetical protein
LSTVKPELSALQLDSVVRKQPVALLSDQHPHLLVVPFNFCTSYQRAKDVLALIKDSVLYEVHHVLSELANAKGVNEKSRKIDVLVMFGNATVLSN